MEMTINVDELNNFMNNEYTIVAFKSDNINCAAIKVNHFGIIKVMLNDNTILETIQPQMAINTYNNIINKHNL